MDDVCWWDTHGRNHARGCYVPTLASDNEIGCVVSEYGDAGIDRAVLCDCDCEVDILCDYGTRG